MTDKSANTVDHKLGIILDLESSLCKIDEGHSDIDVLRKLRNEIRELISLESNGSIDTTKSFSKVLKAARENTKVKRFAALLMLRLISVPGSLPSKKEDPSIEQSISQLVEDALPEFDKNFKFTDKKQTFEKITLMEQVHNLVMEKLLDLKHIPKIMQDIVSQKEGVYKAINNSLVKSYLINYDYSNLQKRIRSLFERADELLNVDAEQFGIKLEELEGLIADNKEHSKYVPYFISRNYYIPLLESFEEATKQLDKGSAKKLDCSISPKKSNTYKAEKKYPLHEIGREVKVTIPLINNGPGIAHDVNAQICCNDDSIAVNEGINLGEIRPGEFPFTLNVLVVESVKEVSFVIDISWNITGQSQPKSISFTCNVQAQDPNIEWGDLVYEEPYSTEIAVGEEFVGRKQKVAVLAKRLLKPRMQSSYITGQKRIGKTSLALAAVREVKAVYQGQNIETIYLEWGDVAHKDPERSVEALGDVLASFLEGYLPAGIKIKKHKFHGSIAPLNVLANTLRDKQPDKKFVIVLDEFDEIPQEMYRYGPLAEAFFSNLRTLSSKNNMAFMLVGGEKMPFIMSAQGDQLNKFVGERLDYFSKTEEYEDYAELVKKPTDKILTWSDGTIDEVFYLTNGHPFYTKLICSKIFSSAVRDRDADISVRDIRRTADNIVCQLDVNQFAHHWKDGVSKSEEEEPISLDRCRVLVAVGHTMRRGNKLNLENICKYHHSITMGEHQIRTILNDFCRRDILKEKGGQFEFVVPLFGMWLEQTGVDKLIADRFGDELAASLEEEEEKARVNSSEIAELVNTWPSYRGREVTAESVRVWLDQVESYKDQRLIFTILENIRFVTELDIREKLKLAHETVKESTPPVVTTKKRQKRNDIIVTYVDGEAKSGQYYASRYAEENKISVQCVIGPIEFTKRAIAYEIKNNVTVNGVVIVDDIVATGGSLSKAVKAFVEENQEYIIDRSISLVIVALLGSAKGVKKVERTIGVLDGVSPELRVMEPLENRYYAFAEEPGIWSSQEEFQRAKALCLNLGAQIYKKNPLGYGELGLLVVFPTTCPNNSLPIIHSSSNAPESWGPLFPRPVN